MSEIVISEFFVNPDLVFIDEVKELLNDFEDSKLHLKALCRNKSAFPFLKKHIKKWNPIHFKWISSHCQDIDFLRKNKDNIDYFEICKNQCIKYLYDLLEEHIDYLDWNELSRNPNASEFLKKHKKYINWYYACMNTSKEVIDMIEYMINSNKFKKIHWTPLSGNPSAIHILKKHINMIDKTSLNMNKNAFEILKDHPELIDYKILCSNHSQKAMELIEKNINHPDISDELLSSNPYAINILVKNPEKIDWYWAIENENIGDLFKAFPDKVNSIIIKYVVKYPSVIPYLKDYLYDISIIKLVENPSIFKIDKEDYKKRLSMVQRLLTKIY